MRSTSEGERKRTFTEEARRRQIVECAIEVLAELGYGHASLAQIAKRANISKGVISYHFEGKDELLEQALVHVYTTGAEYLFPKIMAADGSRARLRAYIEHNIEFLATHRPYAIAVGEIALNLRDADGGLRFGPHTDEPIFEPLEQLLRDGQRAGALCEFSPRVMALAIRRAIDGVPAQLENHDEPDAATIGRELADLFDRATRAAD